MGNVIMTREVYGSIQFIEDLRKEDSGKRILVGSYGAGCVCKEFPCTLPTLIMYIQIFGDIKFDDSYTITISDVSGKGQENIIEVAVESTDSDNSDPPPYLEATFKADLLVIESDNSILSVTINLGDQVLVKRSLFFSTSVSGDTTVSQ